MPAPNKQAKKLPGLRRIRKAREYSQRQLEGLSGVSFVNISRIENGQPATLKTTRKLARALRVPAEELIGYGSSRDGLLDMSGFVRSLSLEPEPYFTDVRLPSEEVHRLYEAVYIRLLRAEKRAAEERWDEPLPDLDQVLRLNEAIEALQDGEEKAQLRERVGKLARRAATVYAREAERLESKAEVIDLGRKKRGPTEDPEEVDVA